MLGVSKLYRGATNVIDTSVLTTLDTQGFIQGMQRFTVYPLQESDLEGAIMHAAITGSKYDTPSDAVPSPVGEFVR
jgi:hypothetical protein